MRMAVTGKAGQVATSLLERGRAAGHEMIALGRPELDLADPSTIHRTLKGVAPDIIISAAAYTAVDKAESESDLAYAINGRGAGEVAQAAHALDVPLVHVSTDYVFDGLASRPYMESDPTGPTGVYGASKLAGEKAIQTVHGANSAILRTSWIYSPFGVNFVKTMLLLAQDRDEISVVADQIGNPTSALDIADGILSVAANLAADSSSALRGIFHMVGQGEGSWADLAEATFAVSIAHSGPTAHVRRIVTADYATPAARPTSSRLNSALIARVHGVTLPDWRSSLSQVIARLQPPPTSASSSQRKHDK